MVIITKFGAVGDSFLDHACKGTIALSVGDIRDLLTFALWSEKYSEVKRTEISDNGEISAYDILFSGSTGSQKRLAFISSAACLTADIIRNDLSFENFVNWAVSWDCRSISLRISLWLDLSLDAFTLVVKLKLDFFIAIIFKTGLDEVITSHLDTGFTAAFLRCSKYHHDLRVNNAVDKRSNRGKRVREEIGSSLEGEITSFAKGSVSSIDALAINVVVFTWLVTWTCVSSELCATH